MTPDELKAARLKLGLTQAQMASLTAYGSYQRWGEIETGRRNPGGAVRLLVLAYLDGYRPANWPSSKDLTTSDS